MPSMQYYFFKPLMYIARWLQGRFPIQDPQALVRFRRRADRLANCLIRPPSRLRVEPAAIAGVPGEWFIPADTPESPVMVFLHGGGIGFGWNNPIRRELACLAGYAGLRAFGVDYRLIPDYTYPAAHDQCFGVYQALILEGKQVVLVGESTGGALALAVMLRAKRAGIAQPLLGALISPVGDFSLRDDRIWHMKDPFAHPRFCVELHRHYLAGNNDLLPDLAPVFADLSGIGPLIVLAGEGEIMRGEVDQLAAVAKQYQVPLRSLFWPQVWHSWHALAPWLPEADQALKALGGAIKQHLPLCYPGTSQKTRPAQESWIGVD